MEAASPGARAGGLFYQGARTHEENEMKFLDRNVILAWGFLSFATCPLALAGPSCDKNPDHPTCGGGGGGDITVTWAVDNTAQYQGGISEPSQSRRECVSELSAVSGTGIYECAPLGLVQINVSGSGAWTQIARNGNQGYCALLDTGEPEFRQFSPTRYWYGNHQGCDFTKGTCEVFASMWSYRGPETPLSHDYFGLDGLEDIGLIRISGTGTVLAVERDGVWEANPFSENRVMNIEVLRITFHPAGKSKAIAECEYEATQLGEITLDTRVAGNVSP